MGISDAGDVHYLQIRQNDSSINEAALLFFGLLLTLIVTLFDRYHRDATTEMVA